MKAARLYGPRDLRIDDLPEPDLAPGTALVRTRAVAICGSDLHYYREGGIGDQRTGPDNPLILGHEFAGELVALGPPAPGTPAENAANGHGPNTANLRPGTLVAVDPAMPCTACEQCVNGNPNLCPQIRFAGTAPIDGGLREFLAWPAHLLYPLPAGMTAEEGAMLEPLGVVIHALDLAKIRLADTVAILGCGTIGLLAVRLANLSGAVRVFATDLLPTRLAAARAMGAHDTIQAASPSSTSTPPPAPLASAGDPVDDPVGRILDLTGGRGVDIVIECAGAPDTPRQAVEMVRYGGTVILVGIPEDDRTQFPASVARRKGVTVKLSRRMKHVYPRALALVQAGLVDFTPLVSHRYALAALPTAFPHMASPTTDVIKAVIEL